jgi:hypothetical protein
MLLCLCVIVQICSGINEDVYFLATAVYVTKLTTIPLKFPQATYNKITAMVSSMNIVF